MPEAKRFLSEHIGAISRDQSGLAISNNRFESAIGVIAGGTGLEALVLAQKHPQAAIVVVDPLARFGRNVVEQISHMSPVKKNRIDWKFFEGDENLRAGYDQLWEIRENKHQTWSKIEKEFLRLIPVAKEARDRIFWAEASTDQAQPDCPLFDRIEINYPLTPLHVTPSLYTFLNRGLAEGGQYRFVTDLERINFLIFALMGNSVTAFGEVDRPKGAKQPISVYDLAYGREKYFYVEGEKHGNLPTPGRSSLQFKLSTFGLSWALYNFIRQSLSDKRVDLQES